MCVWGGVNGFITIERGTEEEVRSAVRDAIEALAPTGFILSPVDNVRADDETTWRNVATFIDAWKQMIAAGAGSAGNEPRVGQRGKPVWGGRHSAARGDGS